MPSGRFPRTCGPPIAVSFSENADEIIRLKDAKRSVPKDLWAAYSRFVVSVRDKNGKERWVRNSSKIDEADEIIRLKDAKRSVPKDLWAAYSRFVVSVRDKNGKERWVRNSSKIDEAVESAGYFALRNNVVSDAFEALAIYRQRNMVEQDFNQLKNWLDGDRLRVGAVSVQGKLLVSTIGTALRMMMVCSAKKMENR